MEQPREKNCEDFGEYGCKCKGEGIDVSVPKGDEEGFKWASIDGC